MSDMIEEYERGFEPDMICRVKDVVLAIKIFRQPPQLIESALRLETSGKVYVINIDPEAWQS